MSAGDDRVAEAIRATAGAVRAPERLRQALDVQRARRDARRRATGAFTAIVVTALAALLLIALPAGDRRSPSIADAAAVALRAPALAAPARDPGTPALLRASVGGVRFPDYAYGGLGWHAEGLRHARHDGREIVVVTYARASGARVGYAIVAGPALRVQAGARSAVRNGMRFTVLRSAGATVVTWRRGGLTCVLASRGASAQALVRLAAWQPQSGSHRPY